ncbi:MAG: MaoC family dehydratase [Pseudomonadota bacterium]
MTKAKTNPGNYFEDFKVGAVIKHATPRTITEGEVALYTALYGTRFAVQSSAAFAKSIGYPSAPLDDLLVFHIVFGKTVPDVSLNAVANLGYAECLFHAPLYVGITLRTESEVIGVKQNSNGKTGTVYVRSKGYDETGNVVLEFVRWVMVRKKDPASPAPEPVVPELSKVVNTDQIGHALPSLDSKGYDLDLAGAPDLWDDYEVGEKIDHVDGMTVEEAEHQLATRLFQNTAKVHFNQHTEGQGRFGRRLIYGGMVISLARALSFNGLANAFHLAAINAGSHVAPLFAGDTVYAWSEILDKKVIPGRSDIGALRTRLVATKDLPCDGFPHKGPDGAYEPGVILDIDLWLIIPR